MATDLIEGYLAHLRSESGADRTDECRRNTLNALNRDLKHGLEAVTADELKAWLWRPATVHGKPMSLGSRETYYGALNGFYTWAHQEGILDFNPMDLITRPKVPQRLPNPVTDEQLLEALSTAVEPYLTWIKLGAYAGLRCMDIANLQRERVTEHTIRVLESKGGAARIVPTHPVVWETIGRLPHGPITDQDARQISMRSWVYFNRKLNMHGVRMHRFRHWFGTMVQRLYKDLLVTQRLLGHKNPATTAGYVLVAAEQTRAAVDLLPRFDAGSFAA